MLRSKQPLYFAHVDESGDPYLDLTKAGTSRFYVVTAVLVEESRHGRLMAHVERVRSNFFGAGEMKSSAVGKKAQRRQGILSALVDSDLRFCAFVVDKSQVNRDSGLKYKKSFIKYLHAQLYKRLYRAFASLHVFADEHGHPEFMESFRLYLQKNYQKELFDHQDFSFVKSSESPMIQAADMIGGSLLRVYTERDSTDLLDILDRATIMIERWPPSVEQTDVLTGLTGQEKFDHLVAQQGIMLVQQFIDNHASTDEPDTLSQVETLHFLLYRYELDQTAYIHAQPILDHVNSCRDEPMSLQSFRMNVIARLRSQGVIIASSNRGYKIPNTTGDIDDFVALVEGQALPYLERLAQAREHFVVASIGDYDIVNPEKYPKLSQCLNSLG